MTRRDAQGRFIRATPEQKVAAHVEKVNAMHAGLPDYERSVFGYEDAGNWVQLSPAQKDQAAAEVFADLPKDEPRRIALAELREEMLSGVPKPGGAYRSQPLEYDNWRGSHGWLYAAGIAVFILVAAIWVLTH
jgi:hypothetical protein